MMYLLVRQYFETVNDHLQMATALHMTSEPSIIASELRSINDIPKEILIQIVGGWSKANRKNLKYKANDLS